MFNENNLKSLFDSCFSFGRYEKPNHIYLSKELAKKLEGEMGAVEFRKWLKDEIGIDLKCV